MDEREIRERKEEEHGVCAENGAAKKKEGKKSWLKQVMVEEVMVAGGE